VTEEKNNENRKKTAGMIEGRIDEEGLYRKPNDIMRGSDALERMQRGNKLGPMTIARGKAVCSDWLLTEGSEQRQLPGSFGINRCSGITGLHGCGAKMEIGGWRV
jgi:hypothetical protein